MDQERKDKLEEIIAEEEAKAEEELQNDIKKETALTKWANEELNRYVKHMSETCKDAAFEVKLRHISDAKEVYMHSLYLHNHPEYGVHHLVRDIVTKLWRGIPLTPLEDKEEEWVECKGSETEDEHRRASFLLREKQKDGSYKYSDESRIVGLENGKTYYMGFLVDILNELEPITFPYVVPDRPYYANTMSFNVGLSGNKKRTSKEKMEIIRAAKRNPGHIVYDTFGIFSITCPSGKIIPVGRYFKYESGERNGKRIEISYDEFLERKKAFDDKVERAIKRAAKKAGTNDD